jgi:hypothetical protein
MATVTTTLAGAVSATATKVVLTAYTAPTGRAKPLLRVNDEIMLIADNSLSPTLGVVRGYMGTLAVAHATGEGVEYGKPDDWPIAAHGPTMQSPAVYNPYILSNAQEMTATGATGTTAASITVPSPAFLNVTGTSGAGINLGVPVVGESYTIKNLTTGALKIYAVGATINGTTGTTAFSLTATGNLQVTAYSSTAGAWQVQGNT